MDEPQIQELSSISSHHPHNKPDLVSIRTKLVAPNNLLPGSIIKSQPPLHLLPVKVGLEAQSGYQMLLDDVRNSLTEVVRVKEKIKRQKNVNMKLRKTKSRNQIVDSKSKDRNLVYQPLKQKETIVQTDDPLAFLNKNIKNLILKSKQDLIFVSRTVLLNSAKTAKQKEGVKNQEQINKMYIKSIVGLQYFGAVPYAYDIMQVEQLKELPQFKKQSQNSDLQFDDNFESSNLLTATKINNSSNQNIQIELLNETYLLTVRLDYNTRSYGQWFYFKVKRPQKLFSFNRNSKNQYKFMIVNMTKSSSMFGLGLKISVCRNGIWRKEGTNIKYYQNSLKRDDDCNPQNTITNTGTYFTLEFTLQIYEGEELYVSYTEPYTFSRVGKLLDRVTNTYQSNKKNIIDIKRYVICSTYLGNHIEVLNFTAKFKQQRQEEKKVIFIVSRCHPVQTAGSHVLQGVINTLSQLFIDCTIEEQKNSMLYKLLENYVIKIIPMLNPDGVILGNSRCNIAGYDMNRSWRKPQPDRCGEVYAVKKYILGYQKRIAMFIDLHAHSKKKNVFAYGCHDNNNPFATRQFPFLLSKLSQNDFLFSECRFARLNKVSETKRNTKDGTARVFLYDVLRIPNVFTIQNSYCSAKDSIFHYDKAAYHIIGSDILNAISLYFSPNFKIDDHKPNLNHRKFQEDQDYEQQKQIKTSFFHRQSTIKLSVRSSRNDLELKIKMNSEKDGNKNNLKSSTKDSKIQKDEQWSQAIYLRQQYLKELKASEKNITVGLKKDQASQSEDEERIYEIIPSKAIRSSDAKSKNKKKKDSKPTDRLVNYLNKTRKQQIDKSPQSKKQTLNISETHSEISLHKQHAKTIRPHKFYTARRGQIYDSIDIQEEEIIENPNIRTHRSRTKRVKTDVSSFHDQKKQKMLSIVDIGTIDRNLTTHSYRFNLAQKIEHKYHSKLLPSDKIIYREPKINGQNEAMLNKKREEEIKQYLRKLVRPRQIIERRQKLVIRQKNEKQEMKIKQSSIEFSNVKLTRLLVHQGMNRRIQTDVESPPQLK